MPNPSLNRDKLAQFLGAPVPPKKPEVPATPEKLKFTAAGASLEGKDHGLNMDSYFVDPAHGAIGALDGLGSYADGASQMAAPAIQKFLATLPEKMSEREAEKRVESFLQTLNEKVISELHHGGETPKTTVAIAKVFTNERGEQKLFIANIGDSCVYVVRDGRIVYETIDQAGYRDEEDPEKFERVLGFFIEKVRRAKNIDTKAARRLILKMAKDLEYDSPLLEDANEGALRKKLAEIGVDLDTDWDRGDHGWEGFKLIRAVQSSTNQVVANPLGGSISPDFDTILTQPGDLILAFTDGLNGNFTDEQILELIANTDTDKIPQKLLTAVQENWQTGPQDGPLPADPMRSPKRLHRYKEDDVTVAVMKIEDAQKVTAKPVTTVAQSTKKQDPSPAEKLEEETGLEYRRGTMYTEVKNLVKKPGNNDNTIWFIKLKNGKEELLSERNSISFESWRDIRAMFKTYKQILRTPKFSNIYPELVKAKNDLVDAMEDENFQEVESLKKAFQREIDRALNDPARLKQNQEQKARVNGEPKPFEAETWKPEFIVVNFDEVLIYNKQTGEEEALRGEDLKNYEKAMGVLHSFHIRAHKNPENIDEIVAKKNKILMHLNRYEFAEAAAEADDYRKKGYIEATSSLATSGRRTEGTSTIEISVEDRDWLYTIETHVDDLDGQFDNIKSGASPETIKDISELQTKLDEKIDACETLFKQKGTTAEQKAAEKKLVDKLVDEYFGMVIAERKRQAGEQQPAANPATPENRNERAAAAETLINTRTKGKDGFKNKIRLLIGAIAITGAAGVTQMIIKKDTERAGTLENPTSTAPATPSQEPSNVKKPETPAAQTTPARKVEKGADKQLTWDESFSQAEKEFLLDVFATKTAEDTIATYIPSQDDKYASKLLRANAYTLLNDNSRSVVEGSVDGHGVDHRAKASKLLTLTQTLAKTLLTEAVGARSFNEATITALEKRAEALQEIPRDYTVGQYMTEVRELLTSAAKVLKR